MNDYSKFDPRRLYRDTQRGVICGVVAGIARHFGFAVGPTRLVVILACFVAFPFVLMTYIGLALVLKPLPMETFETPSEERFWKAVRRSPKATLSDVRYRFRQLDQSLQRMERYVTSPRFKLDRDFRNLERDD